MHQDTRHLIRFVRNGSNQERIKVVWGPWMKLRKGRFVYIYIYKTVVNRKKEINEQKYLHY